jgi:hypothetical protein
MWKYIPNPLRNLIFGIAENRGMIMFGRSDL